MNLWDSYIDKGSMYRVFASQFSQSCQKVMDCQLWLCDSRRCLGKINKDLLQMGMNPIARKFHRKTHHRVFFNNSLQCGAQFRLLFWLSVKTQVAFQGCQGAGVSGMLLGTKLTLAVQKKSPFLPFAVFGVQDNFKTACKTYKRSI